MTNKLLPILMMLVLGSYAMADDSCERYTTSYDRTYCKSKLFVESDKELNDVYKNLRKNIPSSVSEKLKQTQRDWMKYRDNKCETQPGTINVDCNYQVNKDRTEYLRDRLRECKTGSCDHNAVSRQSW